MEHTPELRRTFRVSGPSIDRIASDILFSSCVTSLGPIMSSFSVVSCVFCSFAHRYHHIHLFLVSFLAIIPLAKVYILFFSDCMKLLTVLQINNMAANEISRRLGSLGGLPWITWVRIYRCQRADTDTDT